MAQNLNSKRKHYLALWTSDDEQPTAADWKWLASGITTMGNDTEDVSEDYADYTGVDTTEVTNVRKQWSPEGFVDPEDEAQKIVIDKEYEVGEGRKVWHKWTTPDGVTFQGVARLVDISIAGGDSNTKEELSFTISHERIPEKVENGGSGE